LAAFESKGYIKELTSLIRVNRIKSEAIGKCGESSTADVAAFEGEGGRFYAVGLKFLLIRQRLTPRVIFRARAAS
jgi:hypothetical protein